MMSEQVFSDRPTIELLQWLARGSLKQNLLRAIRLWVWLRSLYGDDRDRLWLSEPFKFADWRHAFFTPTHSKSESIPHLHDPYCACAKTTAEWLFDSRTAVLELEWRQSLQQHDSIDDATLNELLSKRLFAVTRRSLNTDLQILAQLGWLKRQDQNYCRVDELPSHPLVGSSELEDTERDYQRLALTNLDLASINQNLAQPIRGTRRFFLEVDYIISPTNQDRVEDWQDKLKHCWDQTTVPPVLLTYNSASQGCSVKCIVYPICIYYVQRAVYLCAFGQTPKQQGEWYNYRLDRIQQITVLNWTDRHIPQRLQQEYQKSSLPNPDYIQEQKSKAWGFDFYQPLKPMLLRFEREFHDRYIRNTFRHDTFKPVTYKKAEQLIRQFTQPPQQQTLLTVLKSRSHQDAYYHLFYREGDPNVGQRLRAWRPKGEVLLPWELRQSIAKEVETEFKLYQN